MSDRASNYLSNCASSHLSDPVGDEASALTPRVRALVIYQHAFLRDLVTKVLGTGGVEIVAAVRPEDLDESLLDLLRPEVLVVDQAALALDGALKGIAILSRHREVASRVILVDLSDPNMLVWQRRLVANTDTTKLVQAVLENASTCAQP